MSDIFIDVDILIFPCSLERLRNLDPALSNHQKYTNYVICFFIFFSFLSYTKSIDLILLTTMDTKFNFRCFAFIVNSNKITIQFVCRDDLLCLAHYITNTVNSISEQFLTILLHVLHCNCHCDTGSEVKFYLYPLKQKNTKSKFQHRQNS